MRWRITDKGDPDARALVDGTSLSNGRKHYSRQTGGALQWTRNGQNVVLIAEDLLSVWCSFRPTPGKATRPDGLDGYECALFRNENAERKTRRSRPRFLLSSELIREAVECTLAIWGLPGRDGFFTFIKPECIASTEKGRCYLEAGWCVVGAAADGKPRLGFVQPFALPRSWREWQWKEERGGVLRERLETPRVQMHLALGGGR